MQGRIRVWKEFNRKSYGWIYGTDKKTYFFRDKDSGCQEFKVGDNVKFNAMGEKAVDVEKITM